LIFPSTNPFNSTYLQLWSPHNGMIICRQSLVERRAQRRTDLTLSALLQKNIE
jgi:hypothetical protein